MNRVVVDTNVFISALLFGGLPGAFLDLVLSRTCTLVTSAPLLDELDGKLRLKFHVAADDAAVIRARLERVAEIVEPDTPLSVIDDDPDDNRVLECAVHGQVDCIVSGDRHLLRLGAYAAIPILTVRQFVGSVEVPL